MCYLNTKLNGYDRYFYFDDDGQLTSINSADVYDRYCKQTSIINNNEAVYFFDQLRAIKFEGYQRESGPGGEIVSAARRQQVLSLMRRVCRRYGSKHWI